MGFTTPIKKPTNYVEQDSTPPPADDQLDMFCLSSKPSKPYYLDVTLNDVLIQMELDTGAAVSVINSATYDSLRQQTHVSPLQSTDTSLHTYTGAAIKVMGITKIRAKYGGKELYLSIRRWT